MFYLVVLSMFGLALLGFMAYKAMQWIERSRRPGYVELQSLDTAYHRPWVNISCSRLMASFCGDVAGYACCCPCSAKGASSSWFIVRLNMQEDDCKDAAVRSGQLKE